MLEVQLGIVLVGSDSRAVAITWTLYELVTLSSLATLQISYKMQGQVKFRDKTERGKGFGFIRFKGNINSTINVINEI